MDQDPRKGFFDLEILIFLLPSAICASGSQAFELGFGLELGLIPLSPLVSRLWGLD